MKTRLITSSLLIIFAGTLAGCSMSTKKPAPVVERVPASSVSKAPGNARDYYTVKKGDTLYSISLDHGQDYRDIAAWNSLENVGHITIGQQLRVTPPDGSGSTAVAIATPIVLSGSNDARPLTGTGDQLKREPKAGKVPYSEQAKVAAAQQPQPESKPESKPETKQVTSASTEVKSTETKTDAKPADDKSADDKSAGAAPGDLRWMWPASGKLLSGFTYANKGVDIAGKAGDPVFAAADGKVVYSGSGLRGYGKLVIIKHNATFLSAYAHNQDIQVKEGQSVTRGQKIADMGDSDANQVKLHFEIRRQGDPVDPTKYLPSR